MRGTHVLPGHWEIKGNQWNVWRYAQLTVPRGAGQQIVFEAIRGKTYSSDIAIDDVMVREGECPKYRKYICQS